MKWKAKYLLVIIFNSPALRVNECQKTEGAIKNGQFKDTGKIGHIRHTTKINKTKNKHNTTQKAKKMCNTDPTKNQD